MHGLLLTRYWWVKNFFFKESRFHVRGVGADIASCIYLPVLTCPASDWNSRANYSHVQRNGFVRVQLTPLAWTKNKDSNLLPACLCNRPPLLYQQPWESWALCYQRRCAEVTCAFTSCSASLPLRFQTNNSQQREPRHRAMMERKAGHAVEPLSSVV